MAQELVDLLTDASLEINVFRRYIKGFADYRDITCRNTRELMKNNGFHRAMLRSSKAEKDACVTLYLKDVNEVLPKHVRFCEKDSIMLRPERGIVCSRDACPTMSTEYT